MWIISKGGFVSLVQHKDDPSKIRARARRREHLIETFKPFITDDDIIDFGEGASDYRWHVDVPRYAAAQAMVDAVTDIDYISHVKESVAGNDEVFYTAMINTWRELYRLQR